MIKILLLIDYSSEFDRKLLRGLVQYSKENGPWLFYRLPSYYSGMYGEKGILKWAKEKIFGKYTYNAWTEMVAEKPSFREARHKSQFGLIPVETIFEPKYIDGKSHWYGIAREDGMPFTVAAIYENAVINGEQIRSMSMLTINADKHPFMKQFHKPKDEKRSIIVIPDEYREEWLNCSFKEAHEFFFEMQDEYITFPKSRLSENGAQPNLI